MIYPPAYRGGPSINSRAIHLFGEGNEERCSRSLPFIAISEITASRVGHAVHSVCERQFPGRPPRRKRPEGGERKRVGSWSQTRQGILRSDGKALQLGAGCQLPLARNEVRRAHSQDGCAQCDSRTTNLLPIQDCCRGALFSFM